MQIENLGGDINELCRAAGQKLSIGFRSPLPMSAQIAGGWELAYQPKGLSWQATFTYWLSTMSYLRESVMWPYGLQTSEQKRSTFSHDVSAKLTQMQQWIQAM